MTYPQFQKTVMPAVVAYDDHSREQTAGWHDASINRAEKGRGKKREIQDVALAANPKSPYPVYQTLVKSDNYTLQELVESLGLLNRADLRLKSTGQDAAMVVRQTVMAICSKTGGYHT
jgi:DNA polymerase-3 subunit delta